MDLPSLLHPSLPMAGRPLCLPRQGEQPVAPVFHVQPQLPQGHPDRGVDFSEAVFSAADSQFELLREFCTAYGVSQRTLNRVFDRVLGRDAYLRQFRVHLPDLDRHFAHDPDTSRELFDLFNPFAFRADVPRLLPPHSAVDVSFTRFVVSLHRICWEPMSDLIFDFLAACRSNPSLSLGAFVYGFNLQQLVLLLTKDVVRCSHFEHHPH